jgi:hypothetical protein
LKILATPQNRLLLQMKYQLEWWKKMKREKIKKAKIKMKNGKKLVFLLILFRKTDRLLLIISIVFNSSDLFIFLFF